MIKQKSDRDQRTEPTKVVFRSLVLKAPRYITAQGHFTPILFYLSYGRCGQEHYLHVIFVRKDPVCDQKLVSVSTMRSIIEDIDGEFGITFKLDINMTITILI